MKKFFVLFMACAMAASLFAGTSTSALVFNRGQFQLFYAEDGSKYEPDGLKGNYVDALTVPFAYDGTLSLNGYVAADNERLTFEQLIKYLDKDDCVVESVKCSIPVYMTICQPCIDCGLCTELLQSEPGIYEGIENVLGGTLVDDKDPEVLDLDVEEDEFRATFDGTYLNDKVADTFEAYQGVSKVYTTNQFNENTRAGRITRWNIYLADVDKKAKTVLLLKYSLLNKRANNHDDYSGQANTSVYFTGSSKGNAYIQADTNIGNMVMVGKKSNYTFKYYNANFVDNKWETAGSSSKQTAYIKSVSSFKGIYSIAKLMNKYDHDDDDFDTDDWLVDFANEKFDDSHIEGYMLNGTIKLSRNTSYTKQLVEYAFTTVSAPTGGKDWSTCGTPVSANICEEVLEDAAGDIYDSILAGQKYKSYSTVIANGNSDDYVNLLNDLFGLDY